MKPDSVTKIGKYAFDGGVEINKGVFKCLVCP